MQTTLNPEGFGPEFDFPLSRPDNTPNWSESYGIWAYMEDCYLYMHFQRHPDYTPMWRAYATILGEDGSVIATHNFGRQISEKGPGYQQVYCETEKAYEVFHARVDSLAQVSDRKALQEAPIDSLNVNAAITRLNFDFRFESMGPTFQPMPQGDEAEHSNSKWTHYTPCRVTGEITVGDDTKQVDCYGFRDHSAGVRSFETMASGFMFTGLCPSGKSFMAIGVGTEQENGEIQFLGVGGVTIDGRTSYATKLTPPDGATKLPVPSSDLGSIIFETEHGTSEIKMRTTNQGVPFSLVPPNFETIGLPDGLDNELFYHDWRLEIEWDCETGVGGWEPCICKR